MSVRVHARPPRSDYARLTTRAATESPPFSYGGMIAIVTAGERFMNVRIPATAARPRGDRSGLAHEVDYHRLAALVIRVDGLAGLQLRFRDRLLDRAGDLPEAARGVAAVVVAHPDLPGRVVRHQRCRRHGHPRRRDHLKIGRA